MVEDIRYLTERALWETENFIACVPDVIWNKRYDGIPLWKYLYHMLYSMDRWFINPYDPDYRDPAFHTKTLADLNVVPGEEEFLSREQLTGYFLQIKEKIRSYLAVLNDRMLSECPEGCGMTRLRLIIGQHRHWHRHMGIVYGFVIADTGKWPYVLNMDAKYPDAPMPNYYPEQIRAAVLIPVVRVNGAPAFLMEVRSMRVEQPGEICFPGGRIEEGESSVDTAFRETYEELGIPASKIRILKEMAPEPHRTNMTVYPVLAEITSFDPAQLVLSEEEVGEVFTLPLSWLLSHEAEIYDLGDRESEDLPFILRQYLKAYDLPNSGSRTFYWEYCREDAENDPVSSECRRYGIWGLTARLLYKVRESLREK